MLTPSPHPSPTQALCGGCSMEYGTQIEKGYIMVSYSFWFKAVQCSVHSVVDIAYCDLVCCLFSSPTLMSAFSYPYPNTSRLPDKYRMPSQIWISNKLQAIFWLKYFHSIEWDIIMLIIHIYLKFKCNIMPYIFIALIRKLILEPFVASSTHFPKGLPYQSIFPNCHFSV